MALADRLDSLVGLFAAGLAPTGTKDPFGLRRAAIGIVQPLIEHDLDFDLAGVIAAAAKAAADPRQQGDPGPGAGLHRRAAERRAQGERAEIRRGRCGAGRAGRQPGGGEPAVKQLQAWVGETDWATILPAFARCVRITRDQKRTFKVDEKAFQEKEEQKLYAAIQRQRLPWELQSAPLPRVLQPNSIVGTPEPA